MSKLHDGAVVTRLPTKPRYIVGGVGWKPDMGGRTIRDIPRASRLKWCLGETDRAYKFDTSI